jgi:biotin/methionine sulfoxide reductase
MAALGGYVGSVDTYSHAAAEVIVPYVVGHSYNWVQANATSWPLIAEHTQLFVAFGGVPLKNAQIQAGGQGRHLVRGYLDQAHARGCRFVNVSPLRQDLPGAVDAEWLAPRPNSDTALMLALAHTLVAEDRHDAEFLARYTHGADRVLAYLRGEADGQPKDADWAAGVTGLEAGRIKALAREMAGKRTMISVSWSLQRADHGEMAYWAAIALACVLGQIGLPGGGFGLGYGAIGTVGNGVRRVKLPSLPRARNAVGDFIPVARIAEMLERPGEAYRYKGETRTYPDVRLIYWAGGNPFHHHQDLNRLRRAWRRPETVVVHEPFWTATAKHADIVLPATTPLERDDLGGASHDDHLFAMHKAVEPLAEARDDYAIFAELAEQVDGPAGRERFTEGRSADDWLRHLYDTLRQQTNELPEFERFWQQGVHRFQSEDPRSDWRVLLSDFRAEPDAHALPTPSGRIELYSETIESYAYADCPPHPAWLEPTEWLGGAAADRYPLHLLSNQPATRLHSQWDHGAESVDNKVQGREPVLLNPDDAAARGIADGQVVRIHNDRGACLAGARLSAELRPGVAILSTGAHFDPDPEGGPERHGNPNAVTRDAGTSSLAQGPSAQTCLVEIERVDAALRPARGLEPPPFADPA